LPNGKKREMITFRKGTTRQQFIVMTRSSSFESTYHKLLTNCGQGLEIENNAILLANRSACRIAMKEFDAAISDANLCIQTDNTYVKGYFRLATALKGAGKIAESMDAAKIGLHFDPNNAALRKLSFLLVPSKQPKDAPSAADVSMTTVELATLRHLRILIARLQKGEFDGNASSQHMLQGSFSELCSSSFRDTLFPGLSAAELSGLPSNLRQLLRWKNVGDILTQQLHTMAKSAASVLEGVRARGAARGDIMDPTTEGVLIPQIAQETLGREIIAVVRDVNRRAAGENIRNNPILALLPSGVKMDHQLDNDVMAHIVKSDTVAIQDYMFGKELARVLLRDVSRYSRDERMTEIKFSHYISTPSLGKKMVTSDRADMAWIEAEAVEVFYPALAFVLRRLHQLPYELNGKNCVNRSFARYVLIVGGMSGS
jgi:hypothetical protein